MEAKEFLKQRYDLVETITKSQNKLEALKRLYIAKNAEYKIGEVVEIHAKERAVYGAGGVMQDIIEESIRYAVVYEISISDNGNFYYKLYQSDKKGVHGRRRDYYGGAEETLQKLGTYKQ